MNAVTPRARSRFDNRVFVHKATSQHVIAEQEARYQVAQILRTRPDLDYRVVDLRATRRSWLEVLECVRAT